MASLRVRQRKDGTAYTSVLYVHRGRQTSSSFNDHREALRFQDVCNRLGPAEAIRLWQCAAPAEGHTVGSFIDQHLDALSGVERKTLVEYRRYLSRDIGPVLGHIPLSTLTRTDIGRWVNQLRDEGASGKTIGNKLGFLSGCLNLAVCAGHIPANPAAGVRLPRTVRREMTFLTPGEYELLRASFSDYYKPFLDFLVASGCRISEATALLPTDVDRATDTVRIAKAWKRTSNGYELGQPKTRRSTRTINVPKPILDELDYGNEWLFVNSDGGPIRLYSWRANVWSKSLARARKKDENNPEKAVLEKKPRIHDLRHTCASWMLGNGVPLIVVSAHLGHEDPATTARIYGHLDRAAGQAAAEAIAKAMAG